MTAMQQGARFPTRQEVDFVIVGSGAAGGVMAKELSTAGFDVVVLEQGPYRRQHEFHHDELGHWFGGTLMGSMEDHPHSFRKTEDDDAIPASLVPNLFYAKGVGGSSVHFTANFWRLHEVDFRERSQLGPISGTGFTDWPITYDELEPYYTKVDWEIGVSGAPGPLDPPRSRPYPVPPMPVKSSGVLLERGAKRLGLNPFPAPMAILSQPHNGRAGCIHCGFCQGYGCEVGAKSSTLAAMIPLAEATGRCEIRPESVVHRIEMGANNRVREVRYYDRDGNEQAQRAKAVVLCANGAETARLLLMSETNGSSEGLANSSGKVGKYLMFNAQSFAWGVFEHPLNEFKSVQVTRIVHDFYDSDPARGFYGGGGIDARFGVGPMFFALFDAVPPGDSSWGPEYKQRLREYYTHSTMINTHTTSLPLESNNITLDPNLKDKWDRPAVRLTYKDHPDDIATATFLQDRAMEILDAAGARRSWRVPVGESTIGAHLLGTCRMGDDPAESVVDRFHRTHDIPNLFLCDGSSMVTSGRGQPTMTIQALAFRAAEHIAGFAQRGEI